MIDPDNPDGDLPELEPLHKVLPAGGPLLSPSWNCPTCQRRIPGGMPPRSCPAGRPDCPLEFGL